MSALTRLLLVMLLALMTIAEHATEARKNKSANHFLQVLIRVRHPRIPPTSGRFDNLRSATMNSGNATPHQPVASTRRTERVVICGPYRCGLQAPGNSFLTCRGSHADGTAQSRVAAAGARMHSLRDHRTRDNAQTGISALIPVHNVRTTNGSRHHQIEHFFRSGREPGNRQMDIRRYYDLC